MPRGWPVVIAACVVGCHGPSVHMTTPMPVSTAVATSTELPAVTPTKIEPPLAKLPSIDPKTVDAAKLFSANAGTFRGLTEDACIALAAQQSSIGNLLDRENSKPTIRIVSKKQCIDESNERLLRDVRYLAALEARNRDAAEAVERFYQLADAEGRTELLTAGLKSFDELRSLAPKLRDAGLPVPEDDELTRTRSKLLGDIETAEAGIQLLNAELQARLGLSVKGTERLWPTGAFEITTAAIDTEAAVQTALEQRPDLKLLRRLYLGLSVDTLPTVQNQLPGLGGMVSSAAAIPAPRSWIARHAMRNLTEQLRTANQEVVALRKEQLFNLTAERERLAAAEVRVAAVQMGSAARRVALAKSRVESWQAKVEKAKREDKPADRLPLDLEWYKARAELVQEIMAWHRWHAKFRAAQGQLVPPPVPN